MFRPLMHSHRRPPRRGTSFILIVVIMTSIMAAVGVAYALFAMQVGRSTDLQKTAQGGGTAAPPQAPNPYNTINQFFSARSSSTWTTTPLRLSPTGCADTALRPPCTGA